MDYTEEDVRWLDDIFWGAVDRHGTDSHPESGTRAVLAALAAAGRLLPADHERVRSQRGTLTDGTREAPAEFVTYRVGPWVPVEPAAGGPVEGFPFVPAHSCVSPLPASMLRQSDFDTQPEPDAGLSQKGDDR